MHPSIEEAGSRSAPFVAYVGPFRYPWGQPGSRRVHGIARSLAHAGRRVVVGSGDPAPATPVVLSEDGGGQVLHVGLDELHPTGASAVEKLFRDMFTQGASAVAWLERQRPRPTHVIAYGTYGPFIARLLRWCRRNGVPLIADVVEWYEPSHQKLGRFGPFALSNAVTMRRLFPACDGIIAISSLLERYYLSHGQPVLRIPPTLDVLAVPTSPEPRRAGPPLRLIYAGTPGPKDLLASIVRAIHAVDPLGARVHLEVLGVSAEQWRSVGGSETPAVTFLGRVPQQEVASAYRSADFSVLLREPLRYAQAGFPTKVVESLSAGVPVICNVTSDLGEFVRDGVEGIHCGDHREDAFADALRRALALRPDQLAGMRASARACAEAHFDFRVYSSALDRFFVEVAARGRKGP